MRKWLFFEYFIIKTAELPPDPTGIEQGNLIRDRLYKYHPDFGFIEDRAWMMLAARDSVFPMGAIIPCPKFTDASMLIMLHNSSLPFKVVSYFIVGNLAMTLTICRNRCPSV